jgi:hypothetical protein
MSSRQKSLRLPRQEFHKDTPEAVWLPNNLAIRRSSPSNQINIPYIDSSLPSHRHTNANPVKSIVFCVWCVCVCRSAWSSTLSHNYSRRGTGLNITNQPWWYQATNQRNAGLAQPLLLLFLDGIPEASGTLLFLHGLSSTGAGLRVAKAEREWGAT